MSIVVFTPTYRPGIDVSYFSLLRQELDKDDDVTWLVADELKDERYDLYSKLIYPELKRHKIKLHVIKVAKDDDKEKNLCKAYNAAIDYANLVGADMLISLQDYIWASADGIQKWKKSYRAISSAESDRLFVVTGVCSIAATPTSDYVYDREALFSIFKEPYDKKPSEIGWLDCRYSSEADSEGTFVDKPHIEWEINWAMIPKITLESGLRFDEDFDNGLGNDHQLFAHQVQQRGGLVLMDMTNKSLSLPHREYWPEDAENEKPLREHNTQLMEKKRHDNN